MLLETHMKLCVTEPDFLENGPKIGERQGFLNLLKNLVINF